jgi:hypothetical protein
VPLNLDAHPTSIITKTMGWIPTILTVDHKNKWESTRLMDRRFVVGVTPIPYLGFGVIINIVSKEDAACFVITDDIP